MLQHFQLGVKKERCASLNQAYSTGESDMPTTLTSYLSPLRSTYPHQEIGRNTGIGIYCLWWKSFLSFIFAKAKNVENFNYL